MQVSKRIIRLGWIAVSAVLVLLCGASVVQAVTAFAGGESINTAHGEVHGPDQPRQHPASMYAALENSPIFIQAPKAAISQVPVENTTPVERITRLELVLVGAVVNGDGTGVAVIENKRARTQGTYRDGEEILPNVTLDRIESTRVILNNKGVSEALLMLEENGASSSGTRRSGQNAPVPRQSTRQSRGGSIDAPIRRINDNLRVLNRDAFEREYGANAVQTITSASTEQRFVGDQPSGLILRDLGRGNLMEDLGFKRDDVIVAVQGRRTNEPKDLEAIGEFLNTASDIRVQIVRDNLPRTLIFKVR